MVHLLLYASVLCLAVWLILRTTHRPRIDMFPGPKALPLVGNILPWKQLWLALASYSEIHGTMS